MKTSALLSLFILAVIAVIIAFAPSSPIETGVRTKAPTLCDDSLWEHVYHGRFKSAQDRLKVISPCKTITGKIVNAVAEADGDWHIRLLADDPTLLNQKNKTAQGGYLVIEPVCSNPVKQVDTLNEGVCKGFTQSVFNKTMIGKRVQVIGAYVTDMEHGWNEIHYVSSIVVLP